ncbi:MAG: DNA-3-methyladenine glycosylase 2 family protein [Candidatus Eremiobacteraeota bacterium]|nr:DNA-3-methyladenine glycosylase 2 family protein [Candidatus Eremiobacteraeota bacterium]
MTSGKRILLPVKRPFRLDFTSDALRRLAANAVDVVAPDGTYYRAFEDASGAALLAVRQYDETSIEVRTSGRRAKRFVEVAARMLGTQVDLNAWYERSARIEWLHRLAKRFAGVKPPRYASLWEACAHAIVFQQISIHAAGAIMRRAIEALGNPVERAGVRCIPFPGPRYWLDAPEDVLRASGLSRNKIEHLRSAAAAFAGGTIDAAALEALPTPEAAQALTAVRGVGPWSAAVILLRGLGRLDTFPMRDSGVARSLAVLAGGAVDLDFVLEVLGPVRGMLYYHLLLGRIHQHFADPPRL